MKIIVVGGTGATGRHFVNELLSRGNKVTAIVRDTEMIDTYFKNKENLTVIKGNVLEMNSAQILEIVKNCDAMGSCLGHNITLKGMFGSPRKLVAETIQRLCEAVRDNNQNKPVKVVLMNTVGVKNMDMQEKWTAGEGIIMFLIRNLLPPQRDNEQAAEYLRSHIGRDNSKIEWVIVRPDSLVNEDKITEYQIFDSTIRSPLFDAGTTSRINVGNFMSELINNESKWNEWKGKMPVIYNKSSMKGQTITFPKNR
jgi:putative NADH-flavin reductase